MPLIPLRNFGPCEGPKLPHIRLQLIEPGGVAEFGRFI
jgi:hypothetical protein